LAIALAAVAGPLDPQEATRYCAQPAATLVQAMAQATDRFALKGMVEALAAVAPRLEPKEAVRHCAAAATIIGTGAMAETLAEVALRLEPEEAGQFAAILIEALDPGLFAPKTNVLAKILAPVDRFDPDRKRPTCRLSTQQLVDLLKLPTCIGVVRRMILDQLERRYRRRFPDRWAFVHFAQEQKLDLDFITPPKRPVFPIGGKRK
jgi:hypothetical protein